MTYLIIRSVAYAGGAQGAHAPATMKKLIIVWWYTSAENLSFLYFPSKKVTSHDVLVTFLLDGLLRSARTCRVSWIWGLLETYPARLARTFWWNVARRDEHVRSDRSAETLRATSHHVSIERFVGTSRKVLVTCSLDPPTIGLSYIAVWRSRTNHNVYKKNIILLSS
jgi:hypothetical protein